MKTLNRFLLLSLFALQLLVPSVAHAADKTPDSELFGKLQLGQASAELVKLLGQPESKGKDTLWEATGEWNQEWKFPAQGLTFSMASNKQKGAKTIGSINAAPPCKLTTARGIGIGSTEAAVKKAYAKEYDKEQSQPGETFVAGSVYGGVIFTFKNGKVAGIFIGAAAE